MNASLAELLSFVKDNGVGNEKKKDGDVVPWTIKELAVAMEKGITQRTLEYWFSGKKIPSYDKLPLFVSFIVDDNQYLYQKWIVEFRRACSWERLERKKEKAELKTRMHKSGVSSNLSLKKMISIIGLLFCVLFASLVTFVELRLRPEQNRSVSVKKEFIESLKFCTDEGFSKELSICQKNVTFFPKGTKKIYVSFNLQYMQAGQSFERKWYRNGWKFISKKDFYDAAWPGFTYIHNESGHPTGAYVFRVIIDQEVSTHSFEVN